jgi:hypothetical protein
MPKRVGKFEREMIRKERTFEEAALVNVSKGNPMKKSISFLAAMSVAACAATPAPAPATS